MLWYDLLWRTHLDWCSKKSLWHSLFDMKPNPFNLLRAMSICQQVLGWAFRIQRKKKFKRWSCFFLSFVKVHVSLQMFFFGCERWWIKKIDAKINLHPKTAPGAWEGPWCRHGCASGCLPSSLGSSLLHERRVVFTSILAWSKLAPFFAKDLEVGRQGLFSKLVMRFLHDCLLRRQRNIKAFQASGFLFDTAWLWLVPSWLS